MTRSACKAVSDGLKTSEKHGYFIFWIMSCWRTAYPVARTWEIWERPRACLEKIALHWDHLRPFDKGLYHFVQARQFLLRSELGAASAQVELALKTNRKSERMTPRSDASFDRPGHAQQWKAPGSLGPSSGGLPAFKKVKARYSNIMAS